MIIEPVMKIIEEGVDEIAQEILAVEKGIVGKHSRSGAAVGSLHIQVTGEYSRFIGANVGSSSEDGGLHALYLDEGNGSGRIYPKHSKALYLKDYGIYRGSVKTYKGIHWVKDVASRF